MEPRDVRQALRFVATLPGTELAPYFEAVALYRDAGDREALAMMLELPKKQRHALAVLLRLDDEQLVKFHADALAARGSEALVPVS